MRHVMHTLKTAGLLTVALACAKATWAITPFSANYTFNIDNKFSGEATRVLKNTGGNDWQYDFNARIGYLASANESSHFKLMVTPQLRVQSVSHDMNFKILTQKRDLQMTFSPDGLKVFVTRDGQKITYTGVPYTLDNLNLEVQLRNDLKNNQLKPVYYLATEKALDTVKIVNDGPTRLVTPAGTFDTIQLHRVHDDPKRITRFWLAPKLDYLPVKVSQNDNGVLYEITLKQVITPPAR